ncbi:type I toxin-antitoxin system SymE family toxin [Xenorhabdus cabanillasii]|uniref:type I toxin-antitoxin system SymE family toxin n=1 Tax=Xenorhabdus cabanillasii TaxID=351673 RepID=UPI0011C06C09|nr:type I toxin-antitoxin system SymE family toxin [Xenorhabdus cabanillasii]
MAKQAGFDIGGTLIVKIMDDCLVLIPDSDDIRGYPAAVQRQKDQLSEIKLRMREVIGV